MCRKCDKLLELSIYVTTILVYARSYASHHKSSRNWFREPPYSLRFSGLFA